MKERNSTAEISTGDLAVDVMMRKDDWTVHTFDVFDWEYYKTPRGVIVQRKIDDKDNGLFTSSASYIIYTIWDDWMIQERNIAKSQIYDIEIIKTKWAWTEMEEILIDDKDFNRIFKFRWRKKDMKKGSEVLWTKCLV